MAASRTDMCGQDAGASSGEAPAASSTRHALGPAIVTLSQLDVTGLTRTLMPGYSHCSHSSNAAAVRSAPLLLVVTQKELGPSLATTPSSATTPLSWSKRPYRQWPTASVDRVPTYMRSRNRPASGPKTSSLPSGDPSNRPTEARDVRASRRAAASIDSPGRGYAAGRHQPPYSSNDAPCRSCHACADRRLSGRKSAPVRRPAMRPIEIGTNGGRNFVVPTSAAGRRVCSATMEIALTLLVLP